MKLLVITTACLAGFTSSSFAAEVEAVELPAPKEWKKETITLPPGFAPDMKLRGSEHIRFAPGMFQPNSDSFLSYLFLFKLEKEPELKPETIRQEFLKYFRGLAVAVLKDRAAEVNTAKFTLKINPVEVKTKRGSPKPKLSESTGELSWVEPFVTRKPQKLRLEIQTWTGSDHNYMFVCVSPQPSKAPIWKQLRESFEPPPPDTAIGEEIDAFVARRTEEGGAID